MSQEKRKFTKEVKLQILQEASEKGVNATLNRHGIYPATYYNWKKKFKLIFTHVFIPDLVNKFYNLLILTHLSAMCIQ